MLFSSPVFFLFFLTYCVFHRFTPARHRTILIIVASSIFYSYWNPYYFWLPFVLAGAAFAASHWVETERDGHRRRLWIALTILLMPLAFFKYTNFLAETLFGIGTKVLDAALPLGVSFVTFSMIAFVVDVYRGNFKPHSRLSGLLAYTLFFPHLIAGPILRPAELMPQLERMKRLHWRNAYYGLVIFTVGLIKKLVLADPISAAVDTIYERAATASFLDSLVAILGFSAQIYCDFSGYTDMAVGSALVLGVALPNNFARPYMATSFIEFWRRWHITLSSWLRDYLYIPLGGNRHGFALQCLAVIATMSLGGLWHGAAWTFVLWGVLHGLGIIANHAILRVPVLARGAAAIPALGRRTFMFAAVSLLWVLFRARDLTTSGAIIGGLAQPITGWEQFLGEYGFVVAAIAVFLAVHPFDDRRMVFHTARRLPRSVVLGIVATCWMVAIAISTGSSGKFVYFDF